jgi:hypothetical protein
MPDYNEPRIGEAIKQLNKVRDLIQDSLNPTKPEHVKIVTTIDETIVSLRQTDKLLALTEEIKEQILLPVNAEIRKSGRLAFWLSITFGLVGILLSVFSTLQGAGVTHLFEKTKYETKHTMKQYEDTTKTLIQEVNSSQYKRDTLLKSNHTSSSNTMFYIYPQNCILSLLSLREYNNDKYNNESIISTIDSIQRMRGVGIFNRFSESFRTGTIGSAQFFGPRTNYPKYASVNPSNVLQTYTKLCQYFPDDELIYCCKLIQGLDSKYIPYRDVPNF